MGACSCIQGTDKNEFNLDGQRMKELSIINV